MEKVEKKKFVRQVNKSKEQRRREFLCKLGNGALGGAVGVTGRRPIGKNYSNFMFVL